MEGGDSLFFSAAGKAGLGLAQKETKGSMCVFVFGCLHGFVCVGVCLCASPVLESGQQGF